MSRPRFEDEFNRGPRTLVELVLAYGEIDIGPMQGRISSSTASHWRKRLFAMCTPELLAEWRKSEAELRKIKE